METTLLASISILSLAGWMINRLLFRRRLRRVWSAAGAQLKAVESRRKELAAQVHTSQDRYEQLVDERSREREVIESAMRDLEAELNRRSERLAGLESDRTKAIAAIREARARYVETHRQHMCREQELQAKIEEVQSQLQVSEVCVDDAEAALRQQNEQEQAIRQMLTEQGRELEHLRSKLAASKTAYAEQKQRNNALIDRLETREDAIRQLRQLHSNELSAMAERLEQRDQTISQFGAEQASLEQELDARRLALEESQSNFEAEKAELASILSERDACITSLQNDSNHELESLRRALNEQEISLVALKSERQAIQTELQKLSSDLRRRNEKVEELQWQHAVQCDSLKRMLEEVTADVNEQSEQLQQRDETIAHLSSQVEFMETLRSELAERDSQLHQLQDVHSSLLAEAAAPNQEPSKDESVAELVPLASGSGVSSATLAVAECEEGLDDLKRIPGIGKATESSLNALGIKTFRHLAELNDMSLATFAAGFRSRFERNAWAEKARELYEVKYGKQLASDKQLAVAGGE